MSSTVRQRKAAGATSSEIGARSTSPAQNTQAEVARQSWHTLMWLPLIILVPFSIYCLPFIVEMVQSRTEYLQARPDMYKGWSYPTLSDLTTTWWSLLVLLFLRTTLCKFVFTPMGDAILPTVEEKKGKWTAEAREDRVQRFSVCMFKLCYFLVMTVYGYNTLKNVEWLPPELLGTGVVSNAWTAWPYSVASDAVKQYYLIELSYHAHSLVFHLFTIHRNDFIEMTLHHVCAIGLVCFSYFANFIRLGSLVLFLHDIADVMAYAVKAVVDTKYTKLTLMAYAGLLASWGYTRLYVLPFIIIIPNKLPEARDGNMETGLSEHSFVWYTSYSMICLLQSLHVYWYILFLIMGYRFLVTGKTVDIQQKAGETDGSYVDYHKTEKGEETTQEANNSNHTNGVHEKEATVAPTEGVRTRSQKKSSRRAE